MYPILLIIGTLCLAMLWQSNGFLAQAADRLSSAEGAPTRGTDKASIAEGIIDRYILDPRGEVEGILLADGIHMYVTARAEDQLIKTLVPGDHVRVFGRRTTEEGLVQADVINNLTRGTKFIVPLRLDLPMQQQEYHLSMTEMYARGTIRRLLYHPLKAMVQGMVLSDQTQIRLPPDSSQELRRSLHVGESIAVRGNGTDNQFGRAMEALFIGRDLNSLVPLDAALRHLPQ